VADTLGAVTDYQRLLAAADRVSAAWAVSGRSPGTHAAAQAQLRREWPVLALAVEELAAAYRALRAIES
jgi:hypothetical protein